MTAASSGVGARAVTAEFVGTAFLLAGVVGSGIMAETLTDDVGLLLVIFGVVRSGRGRAAALIRVIYPGMADFATQVVVPHSSEPFPQEQP